MSTAHASWLATVLGSKIASYLPNALPPLEIVSNAGVVKGKTVYWPQISSHTVSTVTSTTPTEITVAGQSNTGGTISVTSDKYIDELIQEIDLLQSDVDWQNSYAMSTANAISSDVWTALLALGSSLTTTDIGGSSEYMTENIFKQAYQTLGAAKAPMNEPWFAIVTPSQMAQIKGWERFKYKDIDGGDVFMGSSKIAPDICGFKVYVSHLLDNATSTSATQSALFGCPSMWGLAYSKVPTVNIFQDDNRYFGTRYQVRCIYGVALLRATIGVQCTTGASVVS